MEENNKFEKKWVILYCSNPKSKKALKLAVWQILQIVKK